MRIVLQKVSEGSVDVVDENQDLSHDGLLR